MSCGVLRNCAFQGSSENEGIVSRLVHPSECSWGELPSIGICIYMCIYIYMNLFIEGSLEVKLPTIWTDEKQSREEAERRGRLEERRVDETE